MKRDIVKDALTAIAVISLLSVAFVMLMYYFANSK